MISENVESLNRLPKRALLVISVMKIKRGFLSFAAIYFIFSQKGFDELNSVLSSWLLSFLFLFALIISLALIEYWFTFYGVKDDSLYLRKGLITKKESTIPISNIYTVRSVQGFWLQILDMEILKIDTAGSSGAEMSLVLTEDDAQSLRDRLNIGDVSPVDTEDNGVEKKVLNVSSDDTLQYSLTDLVIAALSKNHFKGMSVLLGVVWFAYSKIRDLFPSFVDRYLDGMLNSVEEKGSETTLFAWVTLIFSLYIVSLILAIIRVTIKYWGMRLKFSGDALFYEAGMFSHSKVHIMYDKIASVRRSRNVLERIMGLETLYIEQSHNVLDQKEDRKSFSSRIIGVKQQFNSVSRLLPSFSDDMLSDKISSHKSYFKRTIKFTTLIPLLLLSPLYYYFPLTLVPAAVWLLLGSICSFMRYQKSYVLLNNDYVVVNSGAFADVNTVIPIHKIELCALRQTFFQKRRGVASLSIATKGDDITIPFIPLADAQRIRDYLLYLVER